jgi:ornithine carbamoyltransferase
MKDLLRIADLERDGLERILNLAAAAKRAPHAFGDVLAGDVVVYSFAEASAQSRMVFATAIARLGGVPQIIGPAELELGREENPEVTARVISGLTRAFVMSAHSDADLRCFAEASAVPVVNAFTDLYRPCQALADLMTLREIFGDLAGLKIGYIGDANSIAHSLMEACALAGVHLKVATPREYVPRSDIVASARERARESNAELVLTNDPSEAAYDADAVYTDAWLPRWVPERQRDIRARVLEPYRVDERIMSVAKPRAVFMHCLPAQRGEEVTPTVIDGPRSIVFQQASNGLPVALAVLVGLLDGSVNGRRRPAIGCVGAAAR